MIGLNKSYLRLTRVFIHSFYYRILLDLIIFNGNSIPQKVLIVNKHLSHFVQVLKIMRILDESSHFIIFYYFSNLNYQ